jgi:hypothetical protein
MTAPRKGPKHHLQNFLGQANSALVSAQQPLKSMPHIKTTLTPRQIKAGPYCTHPDVRRVRQPHPPCATPQVHGVTSLIRTAIR